MGAHVIVIGAGPAGCSAAIALPGLMLVERFFGRYTAYRIAQDWLSFPIVCRLLAETGDPRELLSARGLARAMLA